MDRRRRYTAGLAYGFSPGLAGGIARDYHFLFYRFNRWRGFNFGRQEEMGFGSAFRRFSGHGHDYQLVLAGADFRLVFRYVLINLLRMSLRATEGSVAISRTVKNNHNAMVAMFYEI